MNRLPKVSTQKIKAIIRTGNVTPVSQQLLSRISRRRKAGVSKMVKIFLSTVYRHSKRGRWIIISASRYENTSLKVSSTKFTVF